MTIGVVVCRLSCMFLLERLGPWPVVVGDSLRICSANPTRPRVALCLTQFIRSSALRVARKIACNGSYCHAAGADGSLATFHPHGKLVQFSLKSVHAAHCQTSEYLPPKSGLDALHRQREILKSGL